MKNFTVLLTVLSLLLTLIGCAPRTQPGTPPNKIDSSMVEASYSVSRAISSLSETAQAAHPLPKLAPSPDPAAYGLAGLTTVDWSGPVEPLVREMAKVTGYRFRVLGKEPAIPVMVSVYNENIMIADVLRDVGFQCARRATVAVYPEEHVIELRYARN